MVEIVKGKMYTWCVVKEMYEASKSVDGDKFNV